MDYFGKIHSESKFYSKKPTIPWPLLQHLSGKFISSPPSPRFNDEFVIVVSNIVGGGEGVPYSSDLDAFACYLIQAYQGLLSWIASQYQLLN